MSKKRFSSSVGPLSSTVHSSVLQRSGMVGVVLAVLLAVAGLIAYLTRPEHASPTPPGAPPQSAEPSPHPTPRPDMGQAVAAPPHTNDPVDFAKAATKALWTYDTRHFSHAEHLAGLKRWMTDAERYADWGSVTEQVPGKELWSRLHDNQQHTTATVNEGHFPQAFETALSQNPGAITEAYVYAVTVTGKQSIAWDHGGAGAEARSTTLAVQCRPHDDCALSGVLPEVVP